ncbi:MAG: DUF971 domain-containing protein [Ignavibacteria bacterium]|nr:DUF971 domain-containing protein [Ignavibacteria bacterium]
MNQPKKIKRTDNNSLQIIWNDESVSQITLQNLRDKCPCVSCQGETVLFSSYIPIKSPFKAAGFYEIEKIEPVGNYAVQITWKDKHNTGIYSWDYLRELGKES